VHRTLTDDRTTRFDALPAAPPHPPERPTSVDVDEVQTIVRALLVALGQNPDREGLRETPARVARFWSEFLDHDPGDTGTTFEHTMAGDQYVLVGGIRTWSMCEHHLLPFSAEVSIGYLPAGRVLGLSKLARVVLQFAHRLQLQEQLTSQVAQEVARLTGSPDVGVWTVGEHLCMSVRGVREHSARTVADCLLGRLGTDARLAERLRAGADLARGAR